MSNFGDDNKLQKIKQHEVVHKLVMFFGDNSIKFKKEIGFIDYFVGRHCAKIKLKHFKLINKPKKIKNVARKKRKKYKKKPARYGVGKYPRKKQWTATGRRIPKRVMPRNGTSL